MSSLLSRFRSWYHNLPPLFTSQTELEERESARFHSQPTHITTVDPWPAPPEVSCFVKGVARSMDETPQRWHRVYSHLYVYHGEGGLSVRLDHETSTLALVDDVDISAYESKVLGAAVRRLEQKLLNDKAAVLRAPFEKLACPDATDSPAPIDSP